ncbi:substrate-binding domain-containing protein [Thermomonospora umbrina]|uniref:von Willebrand factor type A domain-containing protein n=1 Tax=Thermomonospora umbrina TaxID=111806 RepID=A0A3D9STH8_9ACTN|nr:substrate-binding domain-containing protein [Thermomonospora umbrina]REE97313.1 von Willebrand factor type A domain-containing protein [Thermomonospora umbrina]
MSGRHRNDLPGERPDGTDPVYGPGGSGASGPGRPGPPAGHGGPPYGPAMERSGAVPPPLRMSDSSGAFGGRQSEVWRSGEVPAGTSGGHRRRRRGRRGPMLGPLAGAVGLLVVLGAGGYALSGFGGCGGGALVLEVAAAPEIAPAVTQAVERFNDEDAKVGDTCVRAAVTAVDPSRTTLLLSGVGVPSANSRIPDVWIPDSSLWTSLVLGSDKGKGAIQVSRTSVASSPIVVGVPRGVAQRLRAQDGTAPPSWAALLRAAAGAEGAGSAGAVRLTFPDPAANATGMGSLMIINTLLDGTPDKDATFTGIVRSLREATVQTVGDQFDRFGKSGSARMPLALTPEQALWRYNQTSPPESAVALYPQEGTLSMDYPYVTVGRDAERRRAAALLEAALGSDDTRADVLGLGFRTPDGDAPGEFTVRSGVDPARPRMLPAPSAVETGAVMQAWAKLSLGLRLLLLTDVSGSMAERVGPDITRMQAIVKVSQGGLRLLSDDTELGSWVFSTDMDGDKPYREIVSVGPLGDRVGSVTRRSSLLSSLAVMAPKPDGDTGLYETVLAAYEHMTDTFKPEFGHSITVLTDGRNDHPGSTLTLAKTLDRLREMQDPNKLVVVNMIGFGEGVDPTELKQIADVTHGRVEIAKSPDDIRGIFLRLLSRRITGR